MSDSAIFYLFHFFVGITVQFSTQSIASSAESFDLHFPPLSQGYAITKDIPNMDSFTFCFRVQQNFPADTSKYGAVLSYRNAAFNKAFAVETNGNIAIFYIDGRPFLFPKVPYKDGKWHHMCIVWDNTTRSFNLFKEGVHDAFLPYSFRKEKGLKGHGTLVIGAEQIPGAGFTKHFNGSISNLNIWNKAFNSEDIWKIYAGCEVYRGNVLSWCQSVINSMITNDIYTTSPSTACDSKYADATFTREINMKLMGHVITKKTVYDELSCALNCLRTCLCKSFNASKRPDGRYYCELNSATGQQFPRDLLYTQNVTYHSGLGV